jgi:AcrR family transcriptional regulator
MTQSLRERQRMLVREEILQTAHTLLGQKGFAVSMDELASCVGVSKPTLYSYFPTKEDLLVEAILHELRPLLHLFEAELAAEQSALASLVLLLQTVISFKSDTQTVLLRSPNPELTRLVKNNQQIIESFQRMHQIVQELVQRAIDQAEIDPSLDLQAIVALFFSLALSVHPPTNAAQADPHAGLAADTASIVQLFQRAVQQSH